MSDLDTILNDTQKRIILGIRSGYGVLELPSVLDLHSATIDRQWRHVRRILGIDPTLRGSNAEKAIRRMKIDLSDPLED